MANNDPIIVNGDFVYGIAKAPEPTGDDKGAPMPGDKCNGKAFPLCWCTDCQLKYAGDDISTETLQDLNDLTNPENIEMPPANVPMMLDERLAILERNGKPKAPDVIEVEEGHAYPGYKEEMETMFKPAHIPVELPPMWLDDESGMDSVIRHREILKAALAERDIAYKSAWQANAERDQLQRDLDESRDIVSRVWTALGIETYTGAHGKSIETIVAENLRDLDAAKELLRKYPSTVCTCGLCKKISNLLK